MNILQLRYAVEVERTGSITMAAKNLYMNQPNLSKAIRELEDDLGIAIFERTAKGVVSTEKGRRLLDHARGILDRVAEMEALGKPDATRKVCFDLCAPRASCVSYAFASFVEALGPDADMHLDYRETNPTRAIKYVYSGIHNLAVVRYQTLHESYFLNLLSERSLQYEPIWSFRRLALMSGRHPLADANPLEPDALLRYTELVYGDAYAPTLPVAEARRLAQENEKRSTITIYERGSQFELLGRVPTTYMWASPMPREALERFGLVQRSCDAPQNDCRDILVSRAGYRYSKEDRLFIDLLRRSIETVSDRE